MNYVRLCVVALLLVNGCSAIVDAGGYSVLSTDSNADADGGPDAAAGTSAGGSGSGGDGAGAGGGHVGSPDTGVLQPDDDAGEPVGLTQPDLEKLDRTLAELAKWACTNLSRCESRHSGTAQRSLEIRLCHPKALELTYGSALRAAVQAREVRFDEDKVDACLASLSTSAIDCRADVLASTQPACEGLLVGQGAEGAACSMDLRCAPGLICAGDGTGCTGSCRVPGGQGDTCVDSSDCDPDHVCLNALCITKAGRAGLPCGSDAECSDGLYCAANHTCAEQAEMDGQCVLGHAESCAGDLLCVQAPVATDPATCGMGIGLGKVCSDDRPCELGGRCLGSRCVPVAIPGGSCNSDAQCPLGSYCGDDGCEPKPTLGEACDEAADASPRKECIEGVCLAGECTVGGQAEACHFDLAVPFQMCGGYCGSDGLCVISAKIVNSACAGDYECAESLRCLPSDPDNDPTAMTCQSPQCD